MIWEVRNGGLEEKRLGGTEGKRVREEEGWKGKRVGGEGIEGWRTAEKREGGRGERINVTG